MTVTTKREAKIKSHFYFLIQYMAEGFPSFEDWLLEELDAIFFGSLSSGSLQFSEEQGKAHTSMYLTYPECLLILCGVVMSMCGASK